MGELYVILAIGDERFGVRARQVIEVLPSVQLSALPGAPAGVVGMAIYRGEALAVVDLVLSLIGRPARPQLGSRILVVEIGGPTGAARLGLLVDKVPGTRRVEDARRQQPVMALPGADWLEAVVTDGAEMLKLVNPEHLLTGEQRAALELAR